MSPLLDSVLICVKFQFKKEQANIHRFRCLIQNQAKDIFYLKSKLNQVSVIPMPN